MRWAVFDEVITAATGDEQDVLAARAEWSRLTGLVHADHELYSERSDAFVEWYVLERCGTDGRTPIDRLLSGDAAPTGGLASPPAGGRGHLPRASGCEAVGAFPLRQEDRASMEALGRSYRSLFQVKEVHDRGVVINDLLGGGRFDVEERRRLPGVAPGDIFEARLVPDPDQPYRLVFSRTFLFHPREAQRAVVGHAEQARQKGEARSSVLFRLQRLRLRCTSYRHVPAQRIYAQQDAP